MPPESREELSKLACKPAESLTKRLRQSDVTRYLKILPGWETYDVLIGKTFRFNTWHELMAFANAVAWIASRENHYPEMSLSRNSCTVEYTTPSARGLTENDFICAAKVEALIAI